MVCLRSRMDYESIHDYKEKRQAATCFDGYKESRMDVVILEEAEPLICT